MDRKGCQVSALLGLFLCVGGATRSSISADCRVSPSARETGGYIAQMVFLPLYTVYLALGARLHALASSLAKHHHRRLDALRCSLTVREESGAPVACVSYLHSLIMRYFALLIYVYSSCVCGVAHCVGADCGNRVPTTQRSHIISTRCLCASALSSRRD